MVAGSVDFLGLNHYKTRMASENLNHKHDYSSPYILAKEDQSSFTQFSSLDWPIVPWGLSKMIEYIARVYPNVTITVSENGCSCNEPTEASAIDDTMRQNYLWHYIAALGQTIQKLSEKLGKSPVDGYFVWSLMDNFEWTYGYQPRFGLIRVNFETLERSWKNSAKWYQKIIRENQVPIPDHSV